MASEVVRESRWDGRVRVRAVNDVKYLFSQHHSVKYLFQFQILILNFLKYLSDLLFPPFSPSSLIIDHHRSSPVFRAPQPNKTQP